MFKGSGLKTLALGQINDNDAGNLAGNLSGGAVGRSAVHAPSTTLPAEIDLTNPSARPGTYLRGTETVDAILKAALRVLINEGAGAFTIRRIAAECGMKVGNVSYHFPRKELLIQVLLDDLLESYDNHLDRRVRQPNLSAEGRLREVIVMCLDDIAGMRTTRLFASAPALRLDES